MLLGKESGCNTPIPCKSSRGTSAEYLEALAATRYASWFNEIDGTAAE
ncbi:MAG: hypothetical protein QY326_06005 [Bdellovibrionota bacterium]|nr:MAG: hypothetical protein QY326_06005 [Bdellovibrionota bacterium]